MNPALCTIYRTFFRYARQLQAAEQALTVRPPLDKCAWHTAHQHSWIVNDAASRTDTLAHLLPGIEEVPQSGHFTPDALRACIRANFAASKDAPADNQDQLLDQAFSALRILSEQMYMQQCSSHTVTNGIQVDVTSVHVGKARARHQQHSRCEGTLNRFTYRVKITNIGDHKAQLISRRWVITDDTGKIVDQVAGAGVVGNTPVLKPYDCFQYYSSATIESMEGAMQGTFQMLQTRPESQQRFDAHILPFRLIAST